MMGCKWQGSTDGGGPQHLRPTQTHYFGQEKKRTVSTEMDKGQKKKDLINGKMKRGKRWKNVQPYTAPARHQRHEGLRSGQVS
jgi:hypothetical protein